MVRREEAESPLRAPILRRFGLTSSVRPVVRRLHWSTRDDVDALVEALRKLRR
jgi:hypothetical protein